MLCSPESWRAELSIQLKGCGVRCVDVRFAVVVWREAAASRSLQRRAPDKSAQGCSRQSRAEHAWWPRASARRPSASQQSPVALQVSLLLVDALPVRHSNDDG